LLLLRELRLLLVQAMLLLLLVLLLVLELLCPWSHQPHHSIQAPKRAMTPRVPTKQALPQIISAQIISQHQVR